MKKTILFVALLLAMVATTFSYSWRTMTLSLGEAFLRDTSASTQVFMGPMYSAKIKALDSLTFYIEGVDTSATIDVKLLTYTVTGMFADTVTVGTLSGRGFEAVTVPFTTLPTYVGQYKALVTVTESSGIRPKRVPYKVILIYKEF